MTIERIRNHPVFLDGLVDAVPARVCRFCCDLAAHDHSPNEMADLFTGMAPPGGSRLVPEIRGSGAGGRDTGLYLAGRRMLICFLASAAVISWGAQAAGLFSSLVSWNVLFASVLLAMAAYFDSVWLQALRRYRTDRIRRELAVVSSQLLYYTGSRLHLHGKLMRCLPLTRLIRVEMGLLLNEWYHDADRALQQFKERLGSDEAYGFTESIRSLRLNETEEVYDLLREMVREYKTKIELAKDGRKETASYLLFVLAGIPILYTFQIFLYPWVQEAARLFKALNP
jgi:hypothetical protein